MIHLERLTASNVAQLYMLGRTPDPPIWIEEVETFVLGEGARDALLGMGVGLIAFGSEVVVGAAFLKPHDMWSGAALLRALLIGNDHRGQRLAQAVLDAVVRSPLATDRSHIVWLVHPCNMPMQRISTKIAAEIHRGRGDDGYDLFIFDR